MNEPNKPAQPLNVEERTSGAAGLLSTQALAVTDNSPEQALLALFVAAAWVAKGCALPSISDAQILEMMKKALDTVAPGAFADLETWRQADAAAAKFETKVSQSKDPTDG